MSVQKKQLVAERTASHHRPIETITENGFSLVRACDPDEARTQEPGKYYFLVRDPNDYELEITVEVSQKAVNEIIARSQGRIARDNTYWMAFAERHLADYLWENDDYPPDASLIVSQLTPDDCDLATRWKDTYAQDKLLGVLFLVAVLSLCMGKGQAQQTVFNVATTDVLEKGMEYFELDTSWKSNDSATLGHFSSFVPRLVVGAGHRVEVSSASPNLCSCEYAFTSCPTRPQTILAIRNIRNMEDHICFGNV